MSLPPTTNTLSPEQRTRLARSAKKLSAVLGSIDTTMLPIRKTTSRALKRQGSVFTASPSIATLDPGSGLSARKRRKPPPLHLRIDPAPVSPPDPSPTSRSPPSTPVTPVPDLAEARRKRLAKLTRHLGEHIPAELVFPPDSAPTVPQNPSRGRSQSVTQTALAASEKSTRNQEWVGEWNRCSIRDVQKELRNLRLR